MALERNQIKPPVLPKEAVQVDALGGEVIVRGLLLSERLALSALNGQLCQPQPGESAEMAQSRAGAAMVSETLARVVVLADGAPLWTEREWNEFGASHLGEVLQLFQTSRRLNGFDTDAAEKN